MENYSTTIADMNEPLPHGYYRVNNFFAVTWSLISIIGLSGNVINLLILPKVQAAGGTKVFLTALSLADLLTATCLITSVIVSRVGREDSYVWDTVSKFCFFLGTWASGASAIFIFMVNLDRFLHVVRPLKYHEIITVKRALSSSVILVIALLALGLSFVSTTEKSFDQFTFHSKNVIYILDIRVKVYLVTSIGIWPLEALVLTMYAHIFCIVRKHAIKISAQENAALRLETVSAIIGTAHVSGPVQDSPNASNLKIDPTSSLPPVLDPDAMSSRPNSGNPLSRKELRQRGQFQQFQKLMKLPQHNFRNLRTTCLITGCYLVEWLPFTILVAMSVFSGKPPRDVTLLVTYTMGKSNCCVNCFLYMFLRSDFKTALRHLFRCR